MRFLSRRVRSPIEKICGNRQLSRYRDGLPSQRMEAPATPCRKEHAMLDLVLLALGLGFFALSVAYAYGCERL
jgi:hypothetical protein